MTSNIPADLIQIVMTTLTVGCMYALVAVGVALIYSATGVINFAQGEFVMLGGMTVASLYGQHDWPLAAAIAVALAVALLYSAVLMILTTAFAARMSLIGVLIITIGASIATQGVAAWVWDSDTHRFAPFSRRLNRSASWMRPLRPRRFGSSVSAAFRSCFCCGSFVPP